MTDVKPIMDWDDQVAFKDACVWWARLDGRWQVEVHRDSPTSPSYAATLHIFDHNDGDKLVRTEPVGLAFEAIFGPDVADVNEWQQRAIDFVDNHLTEKE